ncbi:GTP-binding protein [Anoxybacterium hadale]|uniref:GTP-binding protein n=1 Tax=Anoxybacterium hadale TaxID=3408580 RepID=A0ACD1A7J7_9FIRM|nr:GTP-binding protein [Clostridiales bacterium]
MNIIIFGGFLGAGKTSLILSLASFLIQENQQQAHQNGRQETDLSEHQEAQTPYLVIIENEIGETGIDDKILRAGGYEVRELFAGCVCCTLAADLTVMLNEIAGTLNPQWVIIECTGLAYPRNIADSINRHVKRSDRIRIITVVDAERWEELAEVAPILVEKQVYEADVVLINKIDLTDDEAISLVEDRIRSINASAKKIKLSGGGMIPGSVWKEVTEANGSSEEVTEK